MAFQQVRDNVLYASGYAQGRSFSLSGAASQAYGMLVSKVSSFIALPVPLLSFLALPFFGSTTFSINLVMFYLTWSALVLTHDPLNVELYGTLVTRLLAYLLPCIGFLGFDTLMPSLAASIKAQKKKQLPSATNDRKKLAKITAWSIFNFFLAIGLQSAIELLVTRVFQMRSTLRVSSLVPAPWSIGKDLLKAFAMRGVLHYLIHRYVLHAPANKSFVARWHKDWAHSLRTVFSLAASYDHPVCYLLNHWLPVYLPAVLLRFHIITWLGLVLLTSLESAFIFSGYAVLPSGIVLPGMARRIDAHYATGGKGNFGHWGILDWFFGTTCPGEGDVLDDLHDEADKRDVGRRVSDAVDNADGLVGDARKRFGKKKGGDAKKGADKPYNPRDTSDIDEASDEDQDEAVDDEQHDDEDKPTQARKRRQGRKKSD